MPESDVTTRDRATRQLRWRLRRLRPLLRRPVVARRHSVLEPNDVIVASYPRSGSNWLVTMLGELLVGHEVDFSTRPYPVPSIENLKADPAPRLLPNGGRMIKSHERYRSEYRRAIYLVRHPGDAAISAFRNLPRQRLPAIDFERWFQAWLRGQIHGYGSWQENVESWLDAPIPVQVIRFEDLKEEPEEAIACILTTLGVRADQAAIRRAVENNSLNRMRAKLNVAEGSVTGSGAPSPQRVPAVRGGSDVWKELLSASQRGLLEQHAGRAMERCGYDVGAAPAAR